MEVAGRDRVGRVHQPPDRRHQPVGKVEADQHRGHQDGQRNHREHQREGDLDAEPARFDLRIFGDTQLGLLELRHHARIKQARDIQEGVVERAQPYYRCDVIGVRKDRDLRLAIGDVAQDFRRRQLETALNAGLRRLQDIGILVDQHRAGEIARSRAGRQELQERAAILVVKRPGAGGVAGHGEDIAAYQLGVLIGVGPRDTQRVLDRLARRPGEQPVEAALDRDIGDDGDEHGRQHRND